ncbi:MAG TPA: MBL fold metallo-hydrolase [Nevskiaceae bacterium]|nr:MBL fold metallo-hydrolase [Nevskiaceae bacterium]
MSALPIVDAVTAVLIHRGEMLMVRRQPHLLAFPGYQAFPGGKVDRSDPDQPTGLHRLDTHPHRLGQALLRELREEIGIDLRSLPGLRELHHLGSALTPPVAPLRFNTHFFRIDLDQRPALTLDPGEAADAGWASPAEWQRRYQTGELLVAPPTLAVIEALSRDADALHIPGLARDFESGPMPVIEPLIGVRQLRVLSKTLPPATATNCFVLGDEGARQVLVDPSPTDDGEMERLLAAIAGYRIEEIFLTHHHPDHRERADVMARRLGVPLGLSRETEQHLRRTAPGFLEGLVLRHYQDGDVLTRWLGQPLRVLAVPGHDEGQLALMPDNRAWCLVGDLIQGVGTVVIHRPEGHMGRYFQTLERVIALAPRVIIPSHGFAMGSTYRLEETLRHRREREAQVLALHQAGQDEDAMLAAIYPSLDPRLLPLARANIRSHLEKLVEDGALPA